MRSFGTYDINPAIISIDHFESNCITDLTYAFKGFANVREFKHFDVTSKVTDASHMCRGWENFNGTIPENFCSIFEYLENAYMMFSDWYSYNQPLPEGFFNNTLKLKCANFMFGNWHSFNQSLPEGFFSNIGNKLFAYNVDDLFKNWHSYEHILPEYLINNIKQLSYGQNFSIYSLDNMIDTNLCHQWHKNYQVKYDYRIYGFLVYDYKERDILYLKENHYEKLMNLILMSKIKGDKKIYSLDINGRLYYFVIYDGVFMFLCDILFGGIDQIKRVNNMLGITISNIDDIDRKFIKNYRKEDIIYL